LETDPAQQSAFGRLRARLRLLYHGHTPSAIRFQLGVLLLDFAIIAFFIASPLLRDKPYFLWIDYAIAVLLLLDLTARGLATSDIGKWLRQLHVIVDIFILLTLLLPGLFANLGFLRILRLWTISRGGFIWRPLAKYKLERWREPAQAVINLLVFLFVVTSFIYTFFVNRSEGIDGYVDALYFTVTTITTTGFGDVTLPGTFGRLTSVLVMIIGISLFVRLAQAIFRPYKVQFSCPDCGLNRHDPDAVHCKACGRILNIPDSGR
jgi:voltage-gated potassium channel